MAITLDATTKSIDLTTSTTADIDYAVSWVDMTTTAFTPGDGHGTVNTATTTTIVAAPAASTQRGVKSISVFNRHATTANTVTVKKDVSATEYHLFKATLSAGESLQWTDGGEWNTFDSAGKLKVNSPNVVGITGRNIQFYKSGTASDAIAYGYSYWKDSGFPGVWAPGTPGINGRVTDGTAVADAGCLPLWTPTGGLYITSASLTSTTLHTFTLWDVVWVNSGIAVTTTTAQAITTPTLPARDLNGSTDGAGYMIGLVTTTANTNAAAISNSTVTYTNSAGTGSRTATLNANAAGDNIPATPVIGTAVWFALAAGDSGVRSIQSVTLATSLGGGAVSLIIARPVLTIAPALTNVAIMQDYDSPGVRLWNGSNLQWMAKTSATTATTINGSIVVTEC